MFGFFREKYNLGDVLYCRKSMCTHYGIYVGKGQVVHFASDGKGEILNPEAAVVKKTSLKVFSYGEDIYVNNSPTRCLLNKLFQMQHPRLVLMKEVMIQLLTTVNILRDGVKQVLNRLAQRILF